MADLRSIARPWVPAALLLGGLLYWGADRLEAGPSSAGATPSVFSIARAQALALLALAFGAGLATLRAAAGRAAARVVTPGRVQLHPYLTLWIASFAVLYLELALIRYCGAQLRIFSFYKNVPLIACFLGLGLGCFLGHGDARHALRFLLWFVPFAVALGGGAGLVGVGLGQLAATGSTEQILGDFVPRAPTATERFASQASIAVFCAAVFVAIALLFTQLGRLLGEAFERVPRIPGYTVNVVASLAGILAFGVASFLETPPWVWFVSGLGLLLWWLQGARVVFVGGALGVAAALAVAPATGETVWSRYQKLVGEPIAGGYAVEISDVFYQVAVDRRPEAVARAGRDPFPHYARLFPTGAERVLIVGAGTGNDVAAALHAGVRHVDAVDIDPAIIAMGRAHHPERPYDDPRVRVIIDDARHAFRTLPAQRYDAVVFGLLDSHTQLGMSSVRLDNYVFTLESLESARRLLRPGGELVIAAATFQPWFRERFERMLSLASGAEVRVERFGAWVNYRARVADPSAAAVPAPRDLPSDDWPFLYLPARGVPAAYLWAVLLLIGTSVAVMRAHGLARADLRASHGHFLLLGAAFLLMEVHAINRLALLFGTTWLVSAVAIAIVLSLVVAANLTMLAVGRVPYGFAYAGLAVSLAVSFFVDLDAALGADRSAALVTGILLLSPIYFAGLVFARSFAAASLAGPAIGANILGSVLGGWIEYSTMLVGMRGLVLLAASFYAGSLLLLALAQRETAEGDVLAASESEA